MTIAFIIFLIIMCVGAAWAIQFVFGLLIMLFGILIVCLHSIINKLSGVKHE